jgi:mono/diheme cytochrome c family protein
MKRILLVLLPSTLLGATPADSVRGERLFEALSCVQCHSVSGKGGSSAPDLGRLIGRDFTPAALAATMWNHAPAMWAAMRERGGRPGDLDEQGAADLFAYFYSARFFEKPGDAARGKRLFSSKQCAECHGLTAAKIPEAKPVTEWDSAAQPILLANAMWNHAASMREEFARRKLPWPQLNTQDLADMLVYLRNLPAGRAGPARVEITAGAQGEALFQTKGCGACHTGRLALAPRLKGRTLTDIAVELWNHVSKMAPNPPRLNPVEMQELTSYLWAEQFFADAGKASVGEGVFRARSCDVCHGGAGSGAPRLPVPGRQFTSATMVSALWRHGPDMEQQMKARRIPWPRFTAVEMAGLIAYLSP